MNYEIIIEISILITLLAIAKMLSTKWFSNWMDKHHAIATDTTANIELIEKRLNKLITDYANRFTPPLYEKGFKYCGDYLICGYPVLKLAYKKPQGSDFELDERHYAFYTQFWEYYVNVDGNYRWEPEFKITYRIQNQQANDEAAKESATPKLTHPDGTPRSK